jgi:hypothetical protein
MARIYQSRTLRSTLRDMNEQVKRQASASRLVRSGLSVPEEGVTAVDGDLQSESFVAGSSGWRMRADGSAEFNGVLMGQDTPVQQSAPRTSANGFSLSTTYATLASVNVTVPQGCTRAFAAVFGRMYVLNPNTSGGGDGTGQDAIYVKAGFGGSLTTATPTGISGFGGFATTTGFDAFELDGLTPGGSVSLIVQGRSGYQPIASNADNYINSVAAVTWLR